MDFIGQAVSCNTIGTDTDAQATELAMLKFIKRCDIEYQYLRSKYIPKEMIRFQFDSSRKRMSTIIELDDEEPTEHSYPKRLHVKGASEIVLECCTHYMNANGEKTFIEDTKREELKNVIQNYAKGALRTIGFAYKDL